MSEGEEVRRIVADYQVLLSSIDDWFAGCQAACSTQIRCAAGCGACCRGMFDITLLDAFLLHSGFSRLPAATRQVVRNKCRARLAELQVAWPGFDQPYLLNHLPDELWTEMPEGDMTPCPLLDANGTCLIYHHRPMICRTHGLPNIDRSGEVFSDLYCTLNFVGADPLQLPELRWPFRRAFQQEVELCAAFNRHLLGVAVAEADTFLALAPLIDFPLLAQQAAR